MAKAKPQERFPCTKCDRVTKHTIHARYVFPEIVRLSNEGTPGWTVNHEYLIVQCAGCDHVAFIDDVPLIEWAFIYPEPEKKEFNAWLLDLSERIELPKNISSLYDEVVVAVKNHAPVLAGIGLRALIEAICVKQKIQAYSLHLKIKELHDRGLISKQQLAILDKLRAIGNASAHQMKPIKENTLKHALLAVNHVLREVFILPKHSRKVKL